MTNTIIVFTSVDPAAAFAFGVEGSISQNNIMYVEGTVPHGDELLSVRKGSQVFTMDGGKVIEHIVLYFEETFSINDEEAISK